MKISAKVTGSYQYLFTHLTSPSVIHYLERSTMPHSGEVQGEKQTVSAGGGPSMRSMSSWGPERRPPKGFEVCSKSNSSLIEETEFCKNCGPGLWDLSLTSSLLREHVPEPCREDAKMKYSIIKISETLGEGPYGKPVPEGILFPQSGTYSKNGIWENVTHQRG